MRHKRLRALRTGGRPRGLRDQAPRGVLNNFSRVTLWNKVGLAEYAHCPISEFSGGMKRRVAILRALLADYDILFLDEPFKGLDAETKALVMSDVKQRSQGKTVILVTHDPTESEILGAVYKIEL